MFTLSPSRFTELVASGLIFFAARCLTAQSPQPGGTPVFQTNARTVLVDVVVDNGKGTPVSGLRVQDFKILEDGKPQAIDFFEEHKANTLAAAALKTLPKMPPNVYTNVPPAPQDDAVNVLLLDSLNTRQQDFGYARNEVLGYLNHVKPGTRLAIFTLGDKLNFVQGFTADPAVLKAAIEDKKKGANGGFSQSLVSRSDQADVTATVEGVNSAVGSAASSLGVGAQGGGTDGGGSPAPDSGSAAESIISAFNSYKDFALRNRTLMTLESLDYLARYLANVPGRKNLLWFSSTFPVVVFPHFDQEQEAQDLVVPLSRIQRTADLLTASRIAVYPVNARGVMTESVIDADSRGPGNDPGGGVHMGSIDPTTNYASESADRASVLSAMNQLAHDTGGKAIYNTNDLSSATGRAIADGAQYYTLAYTPTNKTLDGRFRTIDVKMTEGKYKLSYRHGYNADTPSKEAASPEENPLRPVLRFGLPDSTQLLYAVRVVPTSPQPAANAKHAGKNAQFTGPFTRYSLDFMIRWTDVTLKEGANGTHNGKLQLELIAFDRTGKAVNWQGAVEEMSLPPALYTSIERSGIPSHMEVDLPNEPVSLVTGIYDWNAGKLGTLHVTLDPTALTAASNPAH
jgi:VWFA-related protein